MLSESQGFNSVGERLGTAVSIYVFSNISSCRKVSRLLYVNVVLGVLLTYKMFKSHQKYGRGHHLT